MKIHRGCLDPVAGDMDSATMWPRQIHQLIKDAAAHDHLGDQDDADDVVDLGLGEFNRSVWLARLAINRSLIEHHQLHQNPSIGFASNIILIFVVIIRIIEFWEMWIFLHQTKYAFTVGIMQNIWDQTSAGLALVMSEMCGDTRDDISKVLPSTVIALYIPSVALI